MSEQCILAPLFLSSNIDFIYRKKKTCQNYLHTLLCLQFPFSFGLLKIYSNQAQTHAKETLFSTLPNPGVTSEFSSYLSCQQHLTEHNTCSSLKHEFYLNPWQCILNDFLPTISHYFSEYLTVFCSYVQTLIIGVPYTLEMEGGHVAGNESSLQRGNWLTASKEMWTLLLQE